MQSLLDRVRAMCRGLREVSKRQTHVTMRKTMPRMRCGLQGNDRRRVANGPMTRCGDGLAPGVGHPWPNSEIFRIQIGALGDLTVWLRCPCIFECIPEWRTVFEEIRKDPDNLASDRH